MQKLQNGSLIKICGCRSLCFFCIWLWTLIMLKLPKELVHKLEQPVCLLGGLWRHFGVIVGLVSPADWEYAEMLNVLRFSMGVRYKLYTGNASLGCSHSSADICCLSWATWKAHSTSAAGELQRSSSNGLLVWFVRMSPARPATSCVMRCP